MIKDFEFSVITALILVQLISQPYKLNGQSKENLNTYFIDVTQPGKKIVSDKLRLGGVNNLNERIKVQPLLLSVLLIRMETMMII
jgi:hypothetical protein